MSTSDLTRSIEPTAEMSRELMLKDLKILSPGQIEYIIKTQPVLPIDDMRSDASYGSWFNMGGLVKPLVLVNQLRCLEAKEGGHQWLIGERLAYIKDNKLYTELGCKSFSDLCRALPYSSSTINKYIAVYERFTFDLAIKLGSKLSLLIYAPVQMTEELIEVIEGMTYREANEFIYKLTGKDEQGNNIPTKNRDGVHEADLENIEVSINIALFSSGQIKLDRKAMRGKGAAIVIGVPGKRHLDKWQQAVEQSMTVIIKKYQKLMDDDGSS